MHIRLQVVPAIVALCGASLARAFSFTAGAATQCDDLSLSWSGGTAPYQLLMSPMLGVSRNITIPPSAFSNGKGSFSTQVPFPQGQQYILTMSDATGFGTGGTTVVNIVGPSLGGTCNTSTPAPSFTFNFASGLVQCRPFTINEYTQAVQPVKIMGVIPGGQSFVLNPPVGPTTFDWDANVASGTSMVFIMTDAAGGQGGCSPVTLVGTSNDNSCLNGLSPSSTIGLASTSGLSTPTGSGASGTTSTASTTSSAKTQALSVGAIAGIAAGGGVVVILAVIIGIFFLCRGRQPSGVPRWYSHKSRTEVDLTYDPGHEPNASPYPMSSTRTNPSGASSFMPPGGRYDPVPPFPPTTQPPSQYYPYSGSQTDSFVSPSRQHETVPLIPPPTHLPSQHHPQSASGSQRDSFTDCTADHSTPSATTLSTAAKQKATLAGVSNPAPSRVIVHTDVEDAPQPDEGPVVELPPQYQERSGPPGGRPPRDVKGPTVIYLSPPETNVGSSSYTAS